MGLIADQIFDALPEAIRLLLNAAMLLERQKHLQAQPYERTQESQGYANGFKDKTGHTPAVPQVRECGFYMSSPEKGLRSAR